jgi:diguanylate cyclase (GGDEF)-like protein/PAS domain S-box-containing protein
VDSIDPRVLQGLAKGADDLARAAFDATPDGVVVLGRDGSLLFFNQRFLDLWQFPPDMLARRDADEMRQHTAAQLVDPQGYMRTIEPVRSTGQTRLFEALALLDGRQFERLVAPLAAIAGQPFAEGGVIVWWRDVTLRHRAEQGQRDLSALLDLALLAADLAYWDLDVETGEVRSHSERWHAVLGYGPGELENHIRAANALVHPEDAPARSAAWQAHLQGRTPRFEAEFRMRHKAGHWVWLRARGQAVARAADGRATRVVGTRQDITSSMLMQQGLHALAHTDELTGIDNRRRFLQRADDELGRSRRYGLPAALLMIDLDHFKAINDSLGHAAGDAVLRSFASTGRMVLRQSDIFGRIGGEEFAALLPHATLEGACAIGERLLELVRGSPVVCTAATVPYTVSVGVSVATPGGQTMQELMAAADRALYQAKRQGRDRLVVAAP